jgi:hypothetical protein
MMEALGLSGPSARVLDMEHCGRLTRLGFGEALAWLSGGLYGHRSASGRVARAVAVATGESP